jgi:glc operon protein GlcG
VSLSVKSRTDEFKSIQDSRLSWSLSGAGESIMIKYLCFIALVAAAVRPPVPEAPDLVTRGQIKLTLAGAELAVSAAKERAASLSAAENIAVVDDGGHLLAFARMDRARPASVATALTKAVAAATMRGETGPIFKQQTQQDNTFNLAIEHAAAANGGKLTILYGGIPIIVDGQVIGAIGVGGGSEEEDVSVGKAGATALENAVSSAIRK